MDGRGLTTDDAPPDVARPVLVPGTVIADRYRIEARLGAGGGGTVFRCIDQQLGIPVALKVVASDFDLERWRREVAMARQITDRNVCRVHDLGETGELRFVTMELVEGTSLRAKIGPALPPVEAFGLIEQIVAGAAAIHASGIVHRDLKPENIVVATNGRAVIVDFGIAKIPRDPAGATRPMRASGPSPSETQAGVVVGTPRYMSPEQSSGDVVDARTDVWAIALIAHELLTGAMPELGPEGLIVSDRVDARWPGMAATLRRCLAFDPAERFADARALRAAIAPKRKRWPWVVAAAGVIGVGGVVIGLVSSSNGTQEPPTAVDVPYRMLQLTTTTGEQWPDEAPISVALDRTGKQLAYSTAGGKLYVRALAGGSPVAWSPPTVLVNGKPKRFVTARVVGWFPDGALAIAGTTERASHLVRATASGDPTVLHESSGRFLAAVSQDGKRIAIADDRAIAELATRSPIMMLASGDRIAALAWSGDGKLAWMRVTPTGDATIDIDGTEIWRGRTQVLIDPLLAFVGARVAFAFRVDGVTSIATIDPATREVIVHEELAEHVGSGAAANDVLLLVRGPARDSVQIRNQYGSKIERAHGETTVGAHVAGWTPDGRLVFREGDVIVAASPGAKGKPWVTTPAPGTERTDIPAAAFGDLFVRHDAGSAWMIDRVAVGARAPVGRVERATMLRCIANGCVVQQRDGADATWTELDMKTGALGKLVHRRRVGDAMASFALSRDGRLLVIASGRETLVAIDRATGEAVAGPPAAAPGTQWQTLGFDDSGDLWATGVGVDGHLFGLARIKHRDGKFSRPSSLVMERVDELRYFSDPHAHGTDRDLRIAVGVTDLHLEIWRADGL